MSLGVLSDHRGKTSSGRVAALGGAGTAFALALAPLWGGPAPDLILIAMLLGIPGGYSVYQKKNVAAEQPKE